MRKNMAKMAAALLSAALVVTSVNIPGTTSEAATAKISVAKKTLYAGGPSSRKVLTLAVKKGSTKLTGVTFTSSNKAVASVGKKTGLVTAKKKGTAVITAKVGGKKYTSKITVKKWVYATGFAAGATELTIEEGGSQVLTVAYNGDPTKKAAVFTSSDTSTVKVNKKTKKFKVKLTGEKVGQAVITVKPAADVVKKADRAAMTQKVTVNVVPKSEAPSTEPSSDVTPSSDVQPSAETPVQSGDVDHLKAEVTNSIEKNAGDKYENTVLTGQDAYVQVTAYDDKDNPVSGAQIVLDMARNVVDGLPYFMDQNTTTVTTDKNGVATFVLRPSGSTLGNTYTGINPNTGEKIKATDPDYLGSYDITAKDAATNKETKFLFKVARLTFQKSVKQVLDVNGKTQAGATRTSTVAVLNGTDFGNKGYKNLEPGENSNKVWDTQNALGYASRTWNVMNEQTEYVSAQQVSVEDDATKDHKVYLNSDVYLQLPGTKDDKDVAKVASQAVGSSYGPYHLYEDNKEYIQYDPELVKNFENVEYATLVFDKMNLSKYSQIKVYRYRTVGDVKVPLGTVTNNGADLLETYGSTTTHTKNGETALQISLTDLMGLDTNGNRTIDAGEPRADGLVIELESPGRVNLDNNKGYEVKELIYHYNTQTTNEGNIDKLKKAKITWSKDTPVYEGEQLVMEDGANVAAGWNTTIPVNGVDTVMDANAAIRTLIGGTDGKGGIAGGIDDSKNQARGTEYATYRKISYRVPAFPHVGNAIITCYDKDGKEVRYYACTTANDANTTRTVNGVAVPKKTNVNWIDPSDNLYLISKEEAEQSVGEVTQEDAEDGSTVAVVDSTKAGITYVVGEITCDDLDLGLDADHKKVYSSVMWNPVMNTKLDRDAFVALNGQTITLKAKLKDKNGNAAHRAGEKIILNNATAIANGQGTFTVPAAEAFTDVNGEATFTITGAIKAGEDYAAYIGARATSSSGLYDVDFIFNDKKVNIVDLYWFDAKLRYENQVQGTTAKAKGLELSTTAGKDVSVEVDGTEKWEYGVEVVPVGRNGNDDENTLAKANGDVITIDRNHGELGGLTVRNIKNMIPRYVLGAGSTGLVGILERGVVEVTSAKDAKGYADFYLDKTSVARDLNKNAVIVFNNDKEYTFVGGGDTTINQKLTLKYNEGEEVAVITSVDQKIFGGTVNGNTVTALVRVTDSWTDGALAGANVTFSLPKDSTSTLNTITNADGLLTAGLNSGVKDGNTVTVTTNGDGYAAVNVTVAKLSDATDDATKWVKENLIVKAKGLGVEKTEITQEYKKTGVNKDGVQIPYVFSNPKTGFAYNLLAITGIDFTNNTVTVHFNKNIQPETIKKELFEVYYGSNVAIAGSGATAAIAANPVANGLEDFTANIASVEAVGSDGVKLTMVDNKPFYGEKGAAVVVKVREVSNVNGNAVKGGQKYLIYNITSVNGETLDAAALKNCVAYEKREVTGQPGVYAPAVTGYTPSGDRWGAWNAAAGAMAKGNLTTIRAARAAYDELSADEKAYAQTTTNYNNLVVYENEIKTAQNAADTGMNGASALIKNDDNGKAVDVADITTGVSGSTTVTIYTTAYAVMDGTTANGTTKVTSGKKIEFQQGKATGTGTDYFIVQTKNDVATNTIVVAAKADKTGADGKVSVTKYTLADLKTKAAALATSTSADDFTLVDILYGAFNAAGALGGSEMTETELKALNKTIADGYVDAATKAIKAKLEKEYAAGSSITNDGVANGTSVFGATLPGKVKVTVITEDTDDSGIIDDTTTGTITLLAPAVNKEAAAHFTVSKTYGTGTAAMEAVKTYGIKATTTADSKIKVSVN